MKLNIMNNVTRSFHKAGLQLKKHSPEILMVAGVVGTVASAVMACKATLKVNEILEESKTQVEQVKHVLATETAAVKEANKDENAIVEARYTEEDSKKDLAIIYLQTGIKFVKLYGPSVMLGMLSIGSMVAANGILRKRNVALMAAYTAVDTGFKEYRGRVIERFGKELDRELRYNIKAKEIEETVVDEEGNETVVKKTIEVADVSLPQLYSDYAKCFDDGCTGWSPDAEYNKMFLKRQQDQANKLLKLQGYLFLNDVYEMLGIPKTKAGQVVGWMYDERNPRGDNWIDFGIYDLHKEGSRDFVNGYEKSIWLDFNVDGVIYDKVTYNKWQEHLQ